MWQSVGRERYRTIWLEDDIIKAKDVYEDLYPFDKPDLPNAFAKVNDAKSALNFERKYAPLDYDLLLVNTKSEWEFIRKYAPLKYDFTPANLEEKKGGDPVWWVIEQARFVRFALDLMYTLAIKHGRGTLRLFREFVVYEDHDCPGLQGTGVLTYPHGAIIGTTTAPAPKSESDALWYAPSVIALLVNANTKNIHRELMISFRGKIMSVQWYYALIEAIWSMVGDLAMKAQQEGESGYFQRCELCNSVFFAKDKRQRFCPPNIGQQSLCGLKFRQRKCQANKSR